MTRTESQVTDDINKSIINGDLERTTLLLDEWASLFSTPLKLKFLELASKTGSASIVSLLLSRRLESTYYADAVAAACYGHHLNVLQAYVDSGWDINTYLGGYYDLLCLCLDSPSMVKWAIENGADPNANREYISISILEIAVSHQSVECAEILIDMGGAQINNTDALKHAAYHGRTEMIELLLAKGADIDEIPCLEYSYDFIYPRRPIGTALHQAAVVGQLDAVQLLLTKGANPMLRNVAGKTALDLAKEENHEMVVDVLESVLA